MCYRTIQVTFFDRFISMINPIHLREVGVRFTVYFSQVITGGYSIMNYNEAVAKLQRYGQEHLLKYYEELDAKRKRPF